MERRKTIPMHNRAQNNHEPFIERKIIIGCVISTEYLKQISNIWDPTLLETNEAKRITSWCWEYYNKYHKAPGKEIETIYNSKVKEGKIPNDIVEMLEEDILPGLSKEYQEEEFNLEYTVDETVKFFKDQKLLKMSSDISALVESGNTSEAEKLFSEFKPIELTNTIKLDSYSWTVDDIRKMEFPKPRVLLSPWLREGEITFIYGDYGTGKSLLALNIAYLLGLRKYDEPQHEIDEWQVKSPTGCYYIDGEMGAVELEERISKFEWLGHQRKGMKTRFVALPEYQLGEEDEFSLSERKNQLQIVQWLKENTKYKLLVLDSVTTLFGLTEENSNSEWSIKINPLLRDLRALGVATIILHHSGKDKGKGLRGASAMGAMAHNIFYLESPSGKDIDEGEAWFTLMKKKQRAGGFSFKKFTLHYFQNSAFTKTQWEVREGNEPNEPKVEKLNTKQIRIIKYLIRGNQSQKEIAERIGCKPSYINQVKNKAKELGYMMKDGKPTELWNELYERFKNTGEDED